MADERIPAVSPAEVIVAMAHTIGVYDAALDVVAEWGNGDDVDPDRMDERVIRLTRALEDAGVLR